MKLNLRLKRTDIVSIVVAVCMIGICGFSLLAFRKNDMRNGVIKVGFVYDGDETGPFTYNFMGAQRAMESRFGDRVVVEVKSNVPDTEGEAAIRDLVDDECELIFTTSFGYGEAAKKFAAQHPEIQFCQATCYNANVEPVYENYHTFMGYIYQGRYVSGVIAGMKLQEMIDRGVVDEKEARVGYVAAFSYPENISSYTAFLMGVRSVVPTATMDVRYTNTWASFTEEKTIAEELIKGGCAIISQDSDTIGPAVACEELRHEREVYHIGYNESMVDVAPTTSIVGTRINWTPYVLSAVEAVLYDEDIESSVKADIRGNDAGAGFDREWVQMVELNTLIAPEGAQQAIEKTIDDFKHGRIDVFKGNYIGVNPFDPSDTYDLSNGYTENAESSAPTFNYVIEDIIFTSNEERE